MPAHGVQEFPPSREVRISSQSWRLEIAALSCPFNLYLAPAGPDAECACFVLGDARLFFADLPARCAFSAAPVFCASTPGIKPRGLPPLPSTAHRSHIASLAAHPEAPRARPASPALTSGATLRLSFGLSAQASSSRAQYFFAGSLEIPAQDFGKLASKNGSQDQPTRNNSNPGSVVPLKG